jgi:Leucine-rich repeat (LRR) protein
MKHIESYKNKKNDLTFKEWLKNNPKDIYVEYMNCSDCNLIDLNGIEEFKSLRRIDCSNNQLIELPDLSNLKKLSGIFCTRNNLTELPDLSNLTKLQTLACFANKLTELPDLTGLEGLMTLYCYNNNLPFKCTNNKDNLQEYFNWHKKEFPYIWAAKQYNL